MILAADFGTSALKAALIDRDGRIAALTRVPLETKEGIFADVRTWTDALCRASVTLRKETGEMAQAIIVDANGPTLVPWPSLTARLWTDRRATQESRRVSELAGQFIDASFILPKALYIRDREPELYNNTVSFFGAQDFINYALTMETVSVMPLEGLEKWYWNDTILEKLGLDASKFPPFVKMGTKIGTLGCIPAANMGLLPEIPVIAGCPDFVTSIIGSGTMESGILCDRTGTSEGLNLCTDSPSADSRLMCFRHPNTKDYNLSGMISSSGSAISKAMEILGFGAEDYDAFYTLCSQAAPGSGGTVFNPYLNGERAPIWDSGAEAAFGCINSTTTRAELARSACEGVALAVRDVLETIGMEKVREIRVTGAPAGADFLNQLKADVTGIRVVTIDSPDADLLGLGCIALTALGEYESLTQCTSALVRTARVFEPDPELRQTYDALYERYKALYRATSATRA